MKRMSISHGRPMDRGHNFTGRMIGLFCAISVLATAVPHDALAQNAKRYQRIPLPDVSRTQESAVVQMMRAGAIRDEDLFEKFFQKKMAEFTDPANESKLPDLRRNIKTLLQYAGRASSPAAHSRANQWLLNYLPKLAAVDFHPAARCNWILLLGQLDAKEPDSVGRDARPLPAARSDLLKTLQNDKQIDAVLVATLVGLLRHAESGLTGADRDEMVKAMTAFLTRLEQEHQQTPDKRDPQGRAWMEMRAVNVLAALKVADDEVLAALGQRMADTAAPLWLRCAAARALGSLEVNGNVQVDSQQLAEGFANLVDSVPAEDSNRRAMLWSLECVKDGLTGGAATKIAAPHDETTKRWAAGISDLLALFDKPELTDDTKLRESLKQEIVDIRTGQVAAVTAVPVPDPDTDAPPDATDPPKEATSIFDQFKID